MNKALKITFGTVLAMSMATSAFAYEEFLNDTAVWIVGTYTKPSNNGLSVGDLITATPVAGGFDGGRRAIFLEPDYDWDYGLGIRYHIPHTHTHVFMTYDHYRDHKRREDNNLQNISITAPPPTNQSPTEASASVHEHFNEFRLGFSRGLHFGHRFCVDLSAFFEYDRLSRHLHEENSNANGEEAERFTDGKMRGYGPGVGAMARAFPFASYPQFSVFAGIMNTLLFAKNDYNQEFFEDDDFGYEYNPEQSKSVVGKIDINFGLEYCFGFGPRSPRFDIALGMKFQNLFNAFKNGNTAFNPLVQGHPNVNVVNGFAANTGFPQDWGRWGPYVQFSVMGANA